MVRGLKKRYQLNQYIRAEKIRLIDGQKNEVVSLAEGLTRARDLGLDVVQITSGVDPPVCKLVNFKKFLYDQKQKDQKGKARTSGTKEIRFGPNIGQNDFLTKVGRAREFLDEKDKVKVTVQFRGREITHSQIGREKLVAFVEALKDKAKAEGEPKLMGKLLSLMLLPK
ncbi:MAG: translation initiation factor IF-3 [bacterium]|nr:translation initiation factor IF-3 [bacterium]